MSKDTAFQEALKLNIEKYWLYNLVENKCHKTENGIYKCETQNYKCYGISQTVCKQMIMVADGCLLWRGCILALLKTGLFIVLYAKKGE